MGGVDVDTHRARRRGRDVGEHVPPTTSVHLDMADRGLTIRPLDPSGVTDLPAATRMERRAVQHNSAGSGVDDGRVVVVQVGLVVAEVDHHPVIVGTDRGS